MKPIFIFLVTLPFLSFSQSPTYDSLNANNINARFYSAGTMFYDSLTSRGNFEILQGSNQNTIYAAGLWIGGKDSTGQLHLAAQQYSLGKDFYPGPVSDPQYYSTTHNTWDYVWKLTKQEVDDYTIWFNCGVTPGCIQDSSYTIPNSILNWPAHGDPSMGQDFMIAPFYDYNGDGLYEPTQGDRPCIKGDVALFTVFNDDYLHGETGADSLRVEIRAMHYAYNSTDSALANTIFSEYTVLNFSNQTYTDMYIGVFEDMDIGCYGDDLMGIDVERNLAYTFNGSALDNTGCGPVTPFGATPPAQGVVVLKGPKRDADNIDNAIGIGAGESIIGCGFGDGVTDNERLGMEKLVYLSNAPLPTSIYGNPTTPTEYYKYLSGFWKDGLPVTYGGTGHGGTQLSNYCFPDKSDTNYYSGTNGTAVNNWSEIGEGNIPGDRRLMFSMGTFTMPPTTNSTYDRQEFTIAHITARDYQGNSVTSSLDLLKTYTDNINAFYACDSANLMQTCASQINILGVEEMALGIAVKIYPNPTTGKLNFNSTEEINTVVFYSLLGKVVLIKQLKTTSQVDLSILPNGIYIAEVKFDSGKRVIKRVVKK